MKKSNIFFFSLLAILLLPFTLFANNNQQGSVSAAPSFSITVTDIASTETPPSVDTINYQDIEFAYDTIYVTDKITNSKIFTYSVNNDYAKQEISVFSSDENFFPVKIALNLNEQSLYYTSLSNVGIYKTDTEGHYNLKTFLEPSLENSSFIQVDITNVYDLDCSDDGSIFAIARSFNGQDILVYKTKTDTFFNLICFIQDLPSPYNELVFDDNSHIEVSSDKSFITISVNNTIFTLNMNGEIIENKFSLPESLDLICDIEFDWQNNLVILTKGTYNKIILATETEYSVFDDLNNLLSKINAFCLDNENGIMYACNYYTVLKITINNEVSNFFSTISKQIKPDLRNYTLTDVCQILNVNDDTLVYENESLHMLNCKPISNLILIEDNPNSLYYYVLINDYEIFDNNIILSQQIRTLAPEKIELNTGYVLKTEVTFAEKQEPDQELTQVRTIFPNTPVYRFPTTKEDGNGEIIVTVIERSTQNPNPILPILATAKIPLDDNNVDFYAIQYGSIIGYIDKNSVIASDNVPLEFKFYPTGKITEDTNIYADSGLINFTTEITKDKEVQVVEEQNGVAKIYWLEQGVLFVGFVNMNYIDDGNLTTAQVVGISLMAGAVAIAIIILCVECYRRKRKKKKENV